MSCSNHLSRFPSSLLLFSLAQPINLPISQVHLPLAVESKPNKLGQKIRQINGRPSSRLQTKPLRNPIAAGQPCSLIQSDKSSQRTALISFEALICTLSAPRLILADPTTDVRHALPFGHCWVDATAWFIPQLCSTRAICRAFTKSASTSIGAVRQVSIISLSICHIFVISQCIPFVLFATMSLSRWLSTA